MNTGEVAYGFNKQSGHDRWILRILVRRIEVGRTASPGIRFLRETLHNDSSGIVWAFAIEFACGMDGRRSGPYGEEV